jgi:hypothetical protein
MTPETRSEVEEVSGESEEATRTYATCATCARCRSSSFSQRRLWHESKTVFDGDDESGVA